jgi:capsular exopolysaccharide synthesis family protein
MKTTTDSAIPGAAIVDAETYEPMPMEAVALTDPRSPAAEQYKMLRYRLELIAKGGARALVFTSAERGEGKTTTAVNTALALGRGGRNRVLLIDANLHRPHVHKMLGLSPREGLCDVVAGRATLGGTLWRFGADELYVLPAGNPPEDLARVLYDPQLSALLTDVRGRFDHVIVDGPPVLPLADVPQLCRDLDGAVVVVRAGKTSGETLAAALDALYGVTVHGLVLNEVDPRELVHSYAQASLERAQPTLALPAPAGAGAGAVG